MNSLAERRDGIELAMTLMANTESSRAIRQCFVDGLTDSITVMLEPDRSIEDTMNAKHRCLALLDALNRMGSKMAEARHAAAEKVSRKSVAQALGIEFMEDE